MLTVLMGCAQSDTGLVGAVVLLAHGITTDGIGCSSNGSVETSVALKCQNTAVVSVYVRVLILLLKILGVTIFVNTRSFYRQKMLANESTILAGRFIGEAS